MSLPLCHSLTRYSLLETVFGRFKATDGDHVSAISCYTLEERWYQPLGTDGVEAIRRSIRSPVLRVDPGVPDPCASRRPTQGAELAPSAHKRQAVIHAGSTVISLGLFCLLTTEDLRGTVVNLEVLNVSFKSLYTLR